MSEGEAAEETEREQEKLGLPRREESWALEEGAQVRVRGFMVRVRKL